MERQRLEASDRTVIDKAAISQVIAEWAIWRDTFAWEKLRETYTDDGTMMVSWFDGSADDFVAGCKAQAADVANTIRAQHVIASSAIQIAGARAIAETRVIILIRLQVDGVWCDVVAIGRFLDQFARIAEQWRIARRAIVFEKDSIAPVDPAAIFTPDERRLGTFPEYYRWCGYALTQRGLPISKALPAPGSAALDQLYFQQEEWLSRSK